MGEQRLNIVKVPSETSESSYRNTRRNQLIELQAKFERLWLIDPERFNPLRNCMERERLERTWQLIQKHMVLADQPATVDIGCAAGVFSRRLRDAGAHIDAVDISENALKKFREDDAGGIHLKQDAMPYTRLRDHGYHLVVCTELIAEIPKESYRLFFAELARVIHPDGYLVCSSPIDIDTVGAVEKLDELAQSEFDILEEVVSYHALFLRLKRIFKAPSRFIEGWKKPEFKENEMKSLSGMNRWWFSLNSSSFCVWFWVLVEPLTRPILKLLNQNRKVLLVLEKICRFFWDKEGISHYLFIAKRRPLQMMNPEEIPIERPKKKQVWE